MECPITVAICTHNPRRDYLERTLASLAAQDRAKEEWELIIIDNASTNGVAAGVDLSWHPRARLVCEDRIGLTMARLRAIAEARGGLILFVDDDNVLSTEYLTRMLALADHHPMLGVIGAGRIEPEFEEEPDPALTPYLPMLALRSVNGRRWSNDPNDHAVPWGAGMAVRRAVADRYHMMILADPMKQRLDRSGNSLNSCGDDEFSWVACEMGLGKGIFPELHVLHLIGKARLQQDYLLRLAEGHAFSHALLTHLHGGRVPVPEPPPTWRRALGHLVRLQVGMFLYEAKRLWDLRARSPIEHAFISVRRAGIERFHRTIHG